MTVHEPKGLIVSSESEDEGTVIDNNVQPNQVPGISSVATGEMQGHLQEIAG